MNKVMDIDYDRRECNEVDPAEMLMCIQAWHEMINPGHHHIELYADGSGLVIYAANCPAVCDIPLDERYNHPIIRFTSLQDFIRQTREALEKNGYTIIDSLCDVPTEGNENE